MDSDFKKWMDSLGYHGKEVSKAGEAIGVGRNGAQERHQGKRDLSFTERLAMAAVAAGLPAWHPSTQEEIQAIRQVLDSVRNAVPLLSMKWAEDSSERQIPAE